MNRTSGKDPGLSYIKDLSIAEFPCPAKVKGQGKMILTPLLVFHCLTVFTIEMSLVNLDPSLPLQTGLIVYTKMLGLDFSLGEQQQGRLLCPELLKMHY
jgi:hypothetical protein